MASSSDMDRTSPDIGKSDSSQVIITCKGNINDHDLTEKLQKIRQKLTQLSESDDELLSISKIEPWNSVRVTFNIPPEAAQRLQQLAQTDSQVLQNLGILSVQVENNDLVNIPPPAPPASQHVQPPIPVGQSVISPSATTTTPIRMTVANQQSNLMNPFAGIRPNLPWGQVRLPGNMPAGMQGNVQVGVPQVSLPAGIQQGIQAGIQLNMQQQGIQHTTQGGMQPGVPANMQAGIQPGMTPQNIQGNMQTVMPSGIQTGMQSVRQPGIQGQPGLPQGMHGNMQPGLQGNMQPGMQGVMQPGMQGSIQHGMQGVMQSGMQGLPPGMQGNMHPGAMQPGMQPNIQQGMNPNVPPFNQMPQFFYQGEMSMQRFGLNMSPPADARPKKKRRSRPKAKKKPDKDENPDIQPRDTENTQTTSSIKAIASPPPINQASPTSNPNQSVTNQNQQTPITLSFAESTQPTSTTSTPPSKKPDVSLTSPLLVNLLQREIPGTQFPFSSRGLVANTLQQTLNPKKAALPPSTLSQGLPPMPPASEITRMLPESIGLPPLPTNQTVPPMSSPQTNSSAVHNQTPNRQQLNMNQIMSTQQQQFPPTSDTTQPAGDATQHLFGAHQSSAAMGSMPAQQNLPTAGGMQLQQPNSVLQPGLGVPFGQIEQSRQTPTPLSSNMASPVRHTGIQSPGPNNLPFAAPGMTNPNMQHGLPTSLQAQALSSAGPTAVYQQGMNEMIHQGQRQFPTAAPQIRNQLPFQLQQVQQQQHQQQSQINQLNQYFPSSVNQQMNVGQTPSNQGIDFSQGSDFNQPPMFHQRPTAPGNMPFNMVNIPTSNLAQFRMPMSAELPSNKGMMPGNNSNPMQAVPIGMVPGGSSKMTGRLRGNQQMTHSTHLPPTNITFPSIPRFSSKPQSKLVMPFDETTLDGISDAEKDLLAMAEKVANEAGMETSNRMANLFSKDPSRENKPISETMPHDLLTNKGPGQLKTTGPVKMPGEAIKDFKSIDNKQKKPPVIQLSKQPHDMFMGGEQNIASWSSTILPLHGKEGYSLHTSSTSSNTKSTTKGDGNRFRSQGFQEGGPASNSQQMKSTFSLPGDPPTKSLSSQNSSPRGGLSSFETGAQYVSMPRTEASYQNINFISQFNPGAAPDKKSDNPPLAANELNKNKHQNIFGTNAPHQNFNQGQTVPSASNISEKSSILMQMMHMDSTRDNSGMINLTGNLNEPHVTHRVQMPPASDNIPSDSMKMPTLEKMTQENTSQDQQENTEVATLNAEYVAKPAGVGSSQTLMPQLIPKQPSQQQNVNLYSSKSLLLPSCMPPPAVHGSTGNLVSSESQKSATSSQFDKRSRSVSPVTQQGSEFPRLPLNGGQFNKKTPSPTTSSPTGMGMSASALLSSIAKSAYNAGMTPRMQSPSEARPSTSQPIGLPSNTTAPSPTGLPLYTNPLGPDAQAKPITVRVSPVSVPEVVNSTPLLPSVLPKESSTVINEPVGITENSNVMPFITPVEEQPPVPLPQMPNLEAPPELPVPQEEEIPQQTQSTNQPIMNFPIQQLPMNEKNAEYATTGLSTDDISTDLGDVALDQQKAENMSSGSEFLDCPSQLKRKFDNDSQSNQAPKVLKIDSEVPTNTNQAVIEDDLKRSQNTEVTDSDGDLSAEHRPLPLLVRESTIEIGKISTDEDQAVGDMSTSEDNTGLGKEVLTMPTLLPSKVELTDIAKCKDTHQFSFKLENKTQSEEGSIAPEGIKKPTLPKELPLQTDMKSTTVKETTEPKQESTQIPSKVEITSKSPTETSPTSSKDSTKSSPVERRTTPKRRAAEEASRPASERTTSRQSTLQVDEPPATRARRASRNKSPADHPTRLREREDSTSSQTDPGTDTDARMTRKRSTRIIGKGAKDNKDK